MKKQHTTSTKLVADDSVALHHLTAERVACDDDVLHVREKRGVVEVLDDLIDGSVGGYSSLLVRILIRGTGSPLTCWYAGQL
jgi:hypothetical protein